jgi:hypothetical protein
MQLIRNETREISSILDTKTYLKAGTVETRAMQENTLIRKYVDKFIEIKIGTSIAAIGQRRSCRIDEF